MFSNLGQNKPSLFGSLNTGNNSSTPSASPAPQGSSLFGTPQPAQPATGLFGATPAQQPQSGGLFGNTQQNQTTPSGGLFGNTTQQQTANTGSGLFGAAKPQQSSTGLFGQTQAQQPAASGGLFGNAQNNQAAKPGGLFGQSTTQTPPASNLFGAAANATPAAGGGLFGNTNNNAAAQPTSLFGASTNNTSTQPAVTNSLFGGIGGNKPAAPAASGSLFGASLLAPSTNQTNAQAQPAQTNAQHGADQPNAATAQSQPAYFAQLLERGKKRHHGEVVGSTLGDLPSLQLGLGDIARKVKTLSSTPAKDKSEHSRAHYLLAASGVNTGTALKDLSTFDNTTANAPLHAQPAALDTDYDSYIEGLYRQSSLDLVEQGLQRARRDFDAFLEEHVQMEWDAQRARIYEHFGLVKPVELTSVGDNNGSTAKGAFGRSSRRGRLGASSTFAASNINKSVLGNPAGRSSREALFGDVADKEASLGPHTPAPQDRFLRDKQDRYAERVRSLNIARLGETPSPLLHNFAEVETISPVDDASHFVNAYKALAEIVGEDSTVTSSVDAGAVKERQFATDYADDSASSKKAFALRKRIIDGSRRFLERQYLDSLQSAVAKNPREANLGGVPTAMNKVRAYIRLRAIRKELGADSVELQTINQDYCWVLIFHLLRAGLVTDAAQYVSENERAIKSMDRNFPVYMAAFARSDDRRLSPDLQSRISMEYSQRTRMAPENSLDPYRVACYKVIGRCELSRRNLEGINQSMEDWTWLQFALAREVNPVEETASEVFVLDDVRAVIQEIGQRHFSKGADGAGSHGTYFFLQILAGQFEKAIAWLYPHNYLTAVHFAIALSYYGLLRVNDFNGSDDLLSYTTRQQPQISFGHMLGYYTRDFRTSKPSIAADYLMLICLDSDAPGEPGRRQTQLCHDALRELVLETREFAELLGDVRDDGQRIKGTIEQRLKLIKIDNQADLLRQITVVAAQTADDNGRVTDAVLLYHLAEEYDEVINVCCRAVSNATCAEYGETAIKIEPLRPRAAQGQDQSQTQQQAQTQQTQANSSLSLTSVDDAATLARNMLSLYKSNTLMYSKIKPSNRGLIELLLGLSTTKAQIESGKWAPALDTIQALNLLPLDASGNMQTIRHKAQTFNALPTLVSRNVGNLLIWTIVAAGRQRDVLRDSEYEPERKRLEEFCTSVARDTMVFAGLIRYKLSPRVWEVLARVGGDLDGF